MHVLPFNHVYDVSAAWPRFLLLYRPGVAQALPAKVFPLHATISNSNVLPNFDPLQNGWFHKLYQPDIASCIYSIRQLYRPLSGSGYLYPAFMTPPRFKWLTQPITSHALP